jgi:hypothetical protein
MDAIAQVADGTIPRDVLSLGCSATNSALRAFNIEATQYCEGISDSLGSLYAEQYASALRQRAYGLEFKEPRNPGIFEPNRHLIRAALRAMYKRHFNADRMRYAGKREPRED